MVHVVDCFDCFGLRCSLEVPDPVLVLVLVLDCCLIVGYQYLLYEVRVGGSSQRLVDYLHTTIPIVPIWIHAIQSKRKISTYSTNPIRSTATLSHRDSRASHKPSPHHDVAVHISTILQIEDPSIVLSNDIANAVHVHRAVSTSMAKLAAPSMPHETPFQSILYFTKDAAHRFDITECPFSRISEVSWHLTAIHDVFNRIVIPSHTVRIAVHVAPLPMGVRTKALHPATTLLEIVRRAPVAVDLYRSRVVGTHSVLDRIVVS